MIEIGQKVTFNPFEGINIIGSKEIKRREEGVVHFIHHTHHWFNVEYGGEEGKRLISFKFDDIGKNVKLVEEEN